jgi:hypothetical protein
MLKKIRILRNPVKWTILGTTGFGVTLVTGSELIFIGQIISHANPLAGFILLTSSVFITGKFASFLFKEYKNDFGGQNGY